MKEFLHKKGITYTEKDISADEQAFEELVAMGYSATPVTLIDGEAVVGFNTAKLDALLGE